MEYRNFGATDLKTSILGIGCARIGSFHAKGDKKEIFAMFHEAVDSGINFFDTSDIYGQGDSERCLGKALHGKRDKVIFETKAGNCFSQTAKIASHFKAPIRTALNLLPFLKKGIRQVRAAQLSQNFDPSYLANAIDASLRRLQTDYIDIFMLHSPPMDVIEKGEFFELMYRLKNAGKIRYFGISCDTDDQALLCLKTSSIDAIQVPISNKESNILKNFLPLANAQKVGVIARSPFSTGTLLQNANSGQVSNESESRLTVAQNALLSVAYHEGVSTVLAGMSSRQHLRENLFPFIK